MREKSDCQSRSLSTKEREEWGLNAHKGVRTDKLFDLADNSDEANPEVLMNFDDVKKMIAKAKYEHPENKALAWVYPYYYEQRPIAEIAYKMGCGVETAKTRLARAAKFLGDYIQQQEEV